MPRIGLCLVKPSSACPGVQGTRRRHQRAVIAVHGAVTRDVYLDLVDI